MHKRDKVAVLYLLWRNGNGIISEDSPDYGFVAGWSSEATLVANEVLDVRRQNAPQRKRPYSDLRTCKHTVATWVHLIILTTVVLLILILYSYFIEFTRQTCMKKVHDNVHKRYSDKTMLTIKTNLLKIEQAPVNKGTFIGTGGTLG